MCQTVLELCREKGLAVTHLTASFLFQTRRSNRREAVRRLPAGFYSDTKVRGQEHQRTKGPVRASPARGCTSAEWKWRHQECHYLVVSSGARCRQRIVSQWSLMVVSAACSNKR